jgi:hypothetical protein
VPCCGPETLAHDSEKACPGLDPGLTDFSDKIMRKACSRSFHP